MMNLKRTCAVLLSGALLVGALAGCTTNDAGNVSPDATAAVPSPSSAPAGSVELYGDVIETIMGFPGDTTMFTVNGIAVTADEYFYELSRLTSAAVQGFTGEDGKVDWTLDLDGKSLRDVVMESAQQSLLTRIIIREQAAALGIAMTEENKTELEAQIAQVIAQQGGADIFAARLQAIPITEAAFRSVYADNYLVQPLQDAVAGKVEDLTADDAAVTAWAEAQGLILAKHILLSNTKEDGTAMTDEEKAAVKQQSDDMVAQLRASDDPATLFDELMNEFSGDGRNADGTLAAPDGYLFGTGEMVQEFESGAKALAYNEISDPVETSYGYHIILRLPPVNADAVSQWKDSSINDKMTEQMRVWLDAAVIVNTPSYDAVDPGAFNDKLTEIRTVIESRITAATATPAPSASATPEATPAPSAGQ